MAVKDINFRIRILPSADTAKAVSGLEKLGRQWDQVFGPKGEKPVQNQARYVSTLSRKWEDLARVFDGVKSKLSDFNRQGADGLQRFTHSVEGVTRKVFNLKHAIAGTLVGGAAIWGIHKLFEEGSQQISTRNRLKREFGEDAENIMSLGERIGLQSGVQGDRAAKGLIPLAEQLQAIQEGAQFRGMRRKLTGSEAEALRKKNLAFGGGLLQRVQTLVPDMDTDELGRILGDALAGPEGIRSMVSALQLSKRSKTLSALNEKGQAFKALSPEEKKRFGITKAGQYLEQGDLVNLLLQRSGLTDQAALEARKKLPFQLQSIKAQGLDTLGEIGAKAMETLNEKLGKGATLAESLQKYLASDEGKKTIKDISDGVASITEGLIEIAKSIPKIASFFSEHKGTILALATAYAGVKGVGAISSAGSALQAAGGVAGVAKSVGGGALALGGAGLVAAAGAAGYALGTYLDEKLNLSDRISKGLHKFLDSGREDKGVAEHKAKLDERTAARQSKIAELEAKGISHGLAVRYADHPEENPMARAITTGKRNPVTGAGPIQPAGSQPIEVNHTTVLNLDGVKVSEVVEKHLVRGLQNRTARGAAPVSRE